MSNPTETNIQNVIPTTNCFILNGKSFPFNINLFNCFSNYFISKKTLILPNSNINLLDEDEQYLSISDDSIESFINFCHGSSINVNNENVYPLYKLALKYNVKNLINSLETYINEHCDEIVLQFLLINQDRRDSVIERYEEIVSENFDHYINDEKLLLLSIPTLYRIVTKYQIKNQNHTKSEVVSFFD